MNMGNTQLAVIKPDKMTIYDALDIQSLFSSALIKNQKIEVDLSEVVEIDNTGLQLMVAFKNHASEQNKSITFTGHNSQVITLLDLFNINAFSGDMGIL